MSEICFKRFSTWNSQIQGFNDNAEHTTINLSFSMFTLTALLPAHLQFLIFWTIKDARKKQWSQNSHHFPNVYFQEMLWIRCRRRGSLSWSSCGKVKLVASLFVTKPQKRLVTNFLKVDTHFCLANFSHLNYYSIRVAVLIRQLRKISETWTKRHTSLQRWRKAT